MFLRLRQISNAIKTPQRAMHRTPSATGTIKRSRSDVCVDCSDEEMAVGSADGRMVEEMVSADRMLMFFPITHT